MNTKTITIAIIIFLIFLGGIFAVYFYINNQRVSFEEEEKSFFETIFPFGGAPEREIITRPDESIVEIVETGVAPRLRHVSSFPIAGMFTFLNEEDEEMIRYVEKGTGHIYETKTTALGQEKISNTTIPRIYEAVWVDESSVILRYFNEGGDLESFYAELEDGSLDGSFLPKNIENIKVVNNTIRYLLETNLGSSIVRSNPDGTNRVTLYNSPFSEWSVDWWSSTLAILTTKTSAFAFGDSFFLNTNTVNLTKIFDSIPGLTILPNTKNDDILFSINSDGNILPHVFNTETEEFNEINIETLPEKCVWFEENYLYCSVPIEFPSGLYPDDWYKGIVSFSDDIWSIDVEKGTTEVIEYLDDEIDGVNLMMSPTGEYLLFTNKKDSTLWSLRLGD